MTSLEYQAIIDVLKASKPEEDVELSELYRKGRRFSRNLIAIRLANVFSDLDATFDREQFLEDSIRNGN